jgi:hypothetical protein
LPQHLVDQRRLAMIDVGNNGEISNTLCSLHEAYIVGCQRGSKEEGVRRAP